MRYEASDLRAAAEAVHRGGLILYPTDTVWGLGGDATNPETVEKLNALKRRPDGKSYVILVQAMHELERYVEKVPDVAYDLLEAQDRPLTIVYPKAKGLAPGIAAEDGSVAIRLTDDPFCIDLIRKCRCPLISTSANVSGTAFPSFYDEISSEVKEGVDYRCMHRQDDRSKRVPSSLIKIGLKGEVAVLRS